MNTLAPVHSTTAEIDLASINDEVRELLDFLPVLYPGGSAWLSKRLGQVEEGCADRQILRATNGDIAGVMLGVLKPTGRYKISTLFVSPAHRRHGVGSALLDAAIEKAVDCGAHETYITGAVSVRADLEPLLQSRAFHCVAVEQDRYGAGRDECVFVRSN